MAIQYAYVRFLEDNVKSMVKVCDIKNFYPKDDKDFKKDFAYKVLWFPSNTVKESSNDENEEEYCSENNQQKLVYYKAHILHLGESEEEINKKLKTSRLKLPNKKFNYDETYSSSDDSIKKKKVKAKLVITKNAAKETSRAILDERRSILCDNNNSSSSTSEAEQFKKINKKDTVEFWKQKYFDLEKSNTDLNSEILHLKENNERYKKLNLILQERLFKNNSQDTDSALAATITKKNKSGENHAAQNSLVNSLHDTSSSPNSVVDMANSSSKQGFKKCLRFEEGNSTFKSMEVLDEINNVHENEQNVDIEIVPKEEDETKISSLPRYTIFKCTRGDQKVNRIHLGDGIVIDADAWEIISTQKNDSRFIKDLAVSIWGRHVLINRSLDGKGRPRLPNQNENRKVLTPKKRNVLKKCFEDRLRKNNVSGTQLLEDVKKIGPFLTELINYLIKKEQSQFQKEKNCEQT